MGTLYVVRHGQASFGTSDYDRLTETGFTQARLLGAYFEKRHIRFDAVFTGTLRRHIETAQAIFAGHTENVDAPNPERIAGLDEYNPEAVLMAFTGALPASSVGAVKRDPAVIREHFRLLKDALLAWAEGRTVPAGMPTWQVFQDGAVGSLVEARRRFPDGNVLIVSSGGPIAAMTVATLGAPPASAIELNLRIRNSSLTEFASSSRRHALVSFNAVPHLDTHPEQTLITYA